MIESVVRLGESRMSKEDYRDKIEEHRQSFEDEQKDQQNLSRVSRMNKNGSPNKKPKKTKRKMPLMTILFVIFILIPFSILIYFLKFYEPGKSIEEAEKNTSEQVLEIDKSGNKTDATGSTGNKKEDDKAKKEAEDQSKKDAEKLAAEQKAAQEAKKAEEARKAEETRKAEEAKKAEQAKLAQQQAEAARKAEEAKKAEQARKAEEAKNAAKASTHTVKENENLYRIALNHYGDGSEATLAKIRAANGMSSNTVMVGQVIKLP